LPAVGAYVSGIVTLRGSASVHIRLGDFTHVVHAADAIAMAEAIIEQAVYAQKMAAAWTAALAKREDVTAKKEETP
jgi:hypothetical protein